MKFENTTILNIYSWVVGVVAGHPLVTKMKRAAGIAQEIFFLHKTKDEVGAACSREGTVSESLFDRHKIFMDEVQSDLFHYKH